MLPNAGFITFFSRNQGGFLTLVLAMRAQIPQLIEDSERVLTRGQGIIPSLTEPVSIEQMVHAGYVRNRKIEVRTRQRSKKSSLAGSKFFAATPTVTSGTLAPSTLSVFHRTKTRLSSHSPSKTKNDYRLHILTR